jgi:Peptidase C65 Otubain
MEDDGDNKDTTGSGTGLLDPTTSTTTTTHEHLDTFQKTQAQLEAIEKEIKENQPLTSHLMDIVSLRSEYDQDHSSTNTSSSSFFFELGINELAEKYSALRKTRGDGNCYYRSFLYSLSESLLSTPENDNNERVRILQYGTWILQTQQLLVVMPRPSFMSHLDPLPQTPYLSQLLFFGPFSLSLLVFRSRRPNPPTQSTNSQGFHGLCDVGGRVRRDGC